MSSGDEYVEVVSEDGVSVGIALREDAHSDPSILHRVVHVLVFNRKGEILLQKRSMNKDIGPGLWDVSVGGHLVPGETVADAARREMREELGIEFANIRFLYEHIFRNDEESEFVSTFECVYDGAVFPNIDEIDEAAFFSLDRINGLIHDNIPGENFFTEHFEHEIMLYQELTG